jgi:hypothetical protein
MIGSLERLIAGQVCREGVHCSADMQYDNTLEAYKVCAETGAVAHATKFNDEELNWHNHSDPVIKTFDENGNVVGENIILTRVENGKIAPFFIEINVQKPFVDELYIRKETYNNDGTVTIEDNIRADIVNNSLEIDIRQLNFSKVYQNFEYSDNEYTKIGIMVYQLDSQKVKMIIFRNGICIDESELDFAMPNNDVILNSSFIGDIDIYASIYQKKYTFTDGAAPDISNDEFVTEIVDNKNLTLCNSSNGSNQNPIIDLSYINVYDITDSDDMPINDKFHQLEPLTYKPLIPTKDLNIKYSISFALNTSKLDFATDRDLFVIQDAFMKGCIYMATMSQQSMPENMNARNLALQGYEFALKELEKHNQENFTVLIKDKEFSDL